MNEFIEIKNLNKNYKFQQIYEDMNLSLPKKGLIGFVGPSGCGKSTLLNILSGIDGDYRGEIYINGHLLNEFKHKTLNEIRINSVGYLRQHSDLFEQETVYKNVSLPIIATKRCNKKELNDKVMSLLNLVGLTRKVNNYIYELSGGEKQRIALARSLANDPKILLADEPTGNLDSKTCKYIFSILQRLSKNILVLVVTHDENSAAKYCDKIFEYKNHSWVNIYSSKDKKKNVKRIKPMRINADKRSKTFVNLMWWLKHAKRESKSHKIRNYILSFITFISFISIGISVYIGSEINKEVMLSLQQLLGREEIVMKAKNEVPLIGKTSSASYNSVCYLEEKYKKSVLGSGVVFNNDFNSFFKDKDSFYIDLGMRQIDMPMFSASSINEFKWVDEIAEENICYPYKPVDMENDQIVLGLPFAQMMQLTGELRLFKDYIHIGNYLKNTGMKIVLSCENTNWHYYDEQSFSVIGVTKSSVPTIYHTNKKWNSWVFKECMCFPTVDEIDEYVPWALNEVSYLNLLNPYEFFNNVRRGEDIDKFLFEKVNNLPIFKNKRYLDCHKYCVYNSDKKSIKEYEYRNVLNKIGDVPNMVTSDFTYKFYPETFMKGFTFPFFVSSNSECIDTVIDSLTSTSIENVQGDVSIPPNVIKGHYLLPSSSGLTLCNDFSKMMSGRKPRNLNEVVISENLNNKLNNPKILYVTGIDGIYSDSDEVRTTYGKTTVDVVGVSKGDSPVFFVDSFWSIDFFRDKLNLSSIFLEPSMIIVDKKTLNKNISIKELNDIDANYEFINPYDKVNKSLKSTLDYIKISIYSCAIGLAVVSTLLLIYIGIITIIERKNEIHTATIIGLPKNENFKMIYSFLLSLILKPFVASIFSMIIFEYLIHLAIRKQFVGAVNYFDFEISLMPIIAILLMMILSSFLLYIFNKISVYKYLKKN